MKDPFKFENFTERYNFPLFAVIRKLSNSITDVAPKLGKVKYEELERIVGEIIAEAAVPRCQRCQEQMTPRSSEDKITGWICDPCADPANGVEG